MPRASVGWRAVASVAIWVAELIISRRKAHLLMSEHGLHEQEVRDALVCRAGLRGEWQDHPERGLRALVPVEIRETRCLAVLYPVDDPMPDVWALGSCYPKPSR